MVHCLMLVMQLPHMFIINPMMGIGESLSNLFSTHPRTEERIEKLKKQAMNPKYKEKAKF